MHALARDHIPTSRLISPSDEEFVWVTNVPLTKSIRAPIRLLSNLSAKAGMRCARGTSPLGVQRFPRRGLARAASASAKPNGMMPD
jgi:hypothetical protein